ncbi:GCD1 Nucleoside-diphosphate-sugar pyrophosphorylase involved in lipopolysaccharide biosynthesis/translation initiation factor 2B, gamma/epsilon subunits (eIF-2Bgamma/eIF-2Bepsilon) [Burkholderiaceae bacterium]|jgi:D-glycero-alpha-D-manno-heptose 1-phosphate guanylyltransferase
MKAIILCGGLGTRLGALTFNTPKPLLDVAGRPFLAHVLDKLCIPEIDGFILATGFQAEQVSDAIKATWKGRPVNYSQEKQALGTGGAVYLAMESFNLDHALVVNGDTLFDCDVRTMVDGFDTSPWATRMALRLVNDCSRYGRVQVAEDTRVIGFGEKGHTAGGLINAGLYVQRRAPLISFGAVPFSFEVDYLAKLDPNWPIQGLVREGYFIDMGVPEDLARARLDLMGR